MSSQAGVHRLAEARPSAQQRQQTLREGRRSGSLALRKQKRGDLIQLKRVRAAVQPVEVSQSVPVTFDVAKMPDVVTALIKFKVETRLATLTLLSNMLAQGCEAVEAFLSLDKAMAGLMRALSLPETQLQACWCVTNIAAGTSAHTKRAMEAAPYLILFLATNNQYLQEQSAWALGNMAGDGVVCRDLLVAHGVVVPLVRLLQNDCAAVVQYTAYALTNILRGVNADVSVALNAGVVATAVSALKQFSSNHRVRVELLWLFVWLNVNSLEVPTLLAKHPHFLRLLFDICNEASTAIDAIEHVSPMLRLLGQLVCDDATANKVINDIKTMSTLHTLMTSTTLHIQLECAWVISNIAGGHVQCADALIKFGFIPKILQNLKLIPVLQKEAMITLLGISNHDAMHMTTCVQLPTLQEILGLLNIPDIELQHLILQFLESWCRLLPEGAAAVVHGGGVLLLESHQFHSNTVIRAEVNDLLQRYFFTIHPLKAYYPLKTYSTT
eukprot:m.148157 g.148157  ORF g.148157 m.148157 type:complete len:498 (+) comp30575_c4_seq2:297-1790(+)